MFVLVQSTLHTRTALRSSLARRHMKVVAAASFACLLSSAAYADVVLFAANSSLQVLDSNTNCTSTGFFLNLDGKGTTKLSFTTTAANQRVMITFSTGCYAGNAPGNVGVQILVDP